MKKPRTKKLDKALALILEAIFGDFNEPRPTKAKTPRTKSKTSRPKRAGSAGKATNKPRAKAVAGKGKAEVKERRKGKGER